MTNWRECKLSDIANEFAMGPFGSNIKAENFVNAGVPIIRGKNMNFSKYVGGEFVYLTLEKATDLKKSNCYPNDIVFTHRGTIGQVCLIPKDSFPRYVISQSGMKVTIDNDIADCDFIFYFFKSDIGQFELLKNESQVGVPAISSPLTSLKSVELNLPPLPEQKAIAAVLSSLDDKIDLLHRQNKTLEGMAETLFRQWFVEEAEEEWEQGMLGGILSLIESGSRPKGGIDPELRIGVPSIGAENIDGIGKYNYSKTKFISEEFFAAMKRGIVHEFDVLIYKDGAYVGKKGLFGLKFPYEVFTINEHVFILRSNERANQFFLYFLLQEDELSQLNTNSAQPGLNQTSMNTFEITIPPKNLIEQFGDIVAPWIEKIMLNAKQKHTLEKIRDNLLPKIMTGEVRVKYEDKLNDGK